MGKSASSSRTDYLEKKNGRYRVTVAVPRPLQEKLGTRLKRSLGTDSLTIANHLKWPIIAELRALIAEAGGGPTASLVREASELAQLRRRARPESLGELDHAIEIRAEQIAGRPVGVSEDGRTPTFDPSREAAAVQFAATAKGLATPVDLHHPDYLKQISASLTRRTVADDARAVRFLRSWCETQRIPFMLHEVTRRRAALFMDELGSVSGATNTVTHRKYLTRLSRYWRWLMERDHAETNPWTDLKPITKPIPYNERERPFFDEEVSKLLAGPANEAMQDLMRVAALTGARLDAIVDLKVIDCESGAFTFKPQKKEAGPRRVPVHPALRTIIARRCDGRQPNDAVFPEWPPPSNPKSQRERSFKASNAFTAYRRAVGVDEVIEGKRRSLVNFHSFRRWFITKAEQAGQEPHIIASVVGHRRQGMTLGTYSRGPRIEQLRACVEAVTLP